MLYDRSGSLIFERSISTAHSFLAVTRWVSSPAWKNVGIDVGGGFESRPDATLTRQTRIELHLEFF
jgi:hypothetical protein